MTIFSHMLLAWHCRNSLTWDMRLFHVHHILLISQPLTTIFSNIWTHLYATNHSKGEIETVFQDFIASKHLAYDYTGINNHVNQWQKYIERVQRSYFDWLKHCLKVSNSDIKVYSKIRHYFLNNKIIYIRGAFNKFSDFFFYRHLKLS